MKSKLIIEVRHYNGSKWFQGKPYCIVEKIKRKPWLEQIGNFSPMFARYKGKRVLVHSDEGDISDPFRREEGYLKTLWIES